MLAPDDGPLQMLFKPSGELTYQNPSLVRFGLP